MSELQGAARRVGDERDDEVSLLRRDAGERRARVAEQVHAALGIEADEAQRLVASAPCELAAFRDASKGERLADALKEVGVEVRVEVRAIPVREILPDRRVHLDAIGANKVAVMKIVRRRLEVNVTVAKEIVERAPCVLAEALEGGRAAELAAALVDAGATARLA